MSVIQFTVPPLPHYIASGLSLLSAGQKHPSRQNIDVFDLLFVDKGCLYMGEEGRSYEVSEGHALILRPDSYHYAVADCKEDTLYRGFTFKRAPAGPSRRRGAASISAQATIVRDICRHRLSQRGHSACRSRNLRRWFSRRS